MYNFLLYNRNATNKEIEKLTHESKRKGRDYVVSYSINDLEKMIHTLQRFCALFSFKQTGQFDKTVFKNIHQNLFIISRHRGIHNRETHPIFNKILDSLRSIMNNIIEFVTRPLQYFLPTTRKSMINFFPEPKTNEQKTIEHFVKEAYRFMDQTNKLNLG